MATLSTSAKNDALLAIADALVDNADYIIGENMKDIEAGRANGLNEGLIDRLALDEGRISGIAEGLRQIAALPDPIGETVWGAKRPNGLAVTKVRVSLGVIGVIYEARPNVTADAAGLCIKSGNAVILKRRQGGL